MRTLILILLCFNLYGQDNFKFAPDKQKHFAVGASFGSGMTYYMYKKDHYGDIDAILVPQMPMACIGMAKEMLDVSAGRNGSMHDVFYGQLGCLTGSLITYGIAKYIDHRKQKQTNKIEKKCI